MRWADEGIPERWAILVLTSRRLFSIQPEARARWTLTRNTLTATDSTITYAGIRAMARMTPVCIVLVEDVTDR